MSSSAAAENDAPGGRQRRRRLVLVTGGSRGIGRATSLLLTRRGFDVAVNFRSDESSARAVAEEAKARAGAGAPTDGKEGGGEGEASSGAGEIRIFKADVSDEEDVRRLFREVASSFGTEPDGLVNSAGIVGTKDDDDVASMKKEDMDAVFATNVYGPFYCCREFVRRRREMTAGGGAAPSNDDGGEDEGERAAKRPRVCAGGSIVNVSSSLMKLKGRPVFYAMSKSALDTMMVGLSKTLPPSDGIRINAVAPGTTETDLVSKERAEALKSVIPMGRVARPEEVAETILFLLDDERSGYCCGATISVTGGR